MAQRLVEEVQREIDEEVLRKVFVESGWTQVNINYTSNKQAVDIIDWCMESFEKNKWKRLNGFFVFRDKKDAEWFILRWL